jgi:putative oxidoreductase
MSGLAAHPRVELVLRLLLGGFFVYASLDKIASPAAFAKIIYQWQIGGPVAANLVAVTLPWIELVAGLLLIAGVWRREAALVIALLLVVFLVAAVSVMARGIDVQNCGCLSVAKTETPPAWPPAWTKGVGWFLITRNLVLLAASSALVLARPLPPKPDGAPGPSPAQVTA